MAQPKRKHTPGRKRRKSAHKHWAPPALANCPQCGNPKPAHTVCPACGFYRKREVISSP